MKTVSNIPPETETKNYRRIVCRQSVKKYNEEFRNETKFKNIFKNEIRSENKNE